MFKKLLAVLTTTLLILTPLSVNAASAQTANTVTVAMSTDNNYVIPTVMAITSLAKSANSNTNYKVYILYADDISSNNKDTIMSLENTYKNCAITFINMGKDFENLSVPSNYTKAIYYRLKLPSLLLNENRCIYIDVDTIITEDLSQLFNTDMKDCYVAGVRDIVIRQIDDQEYLKLLNFKDPYNYINSGVLLMDLEKMREDTIEEKFDKFIKEKIKMGIDLHFPDQDVINCVCQDRVYYLPCKFNMMVTIEDLLDSYSGCFNIKKFDETLCFTTEEWQEGLKNPVIIHYAGPMKPWRDLNVKMSSKWWEFVDNAKLRQKILETYDLVL